MILLDQKTNSSDNKPLNLSYKKDEKPSSSFSQLLKGVSEKDALVLALDSDETAEISLVEDKDKKNFSTLLKNTSVTELKQDSKKENKNTLAINEKLEINPQITNNISPKDLKVLISDAKKYLKDKILQSDNYKIAQTKELPKTLKGLVKVAKTFGIDVSKISLEEVKSQKSNSNIEIEVDAKIDLKSKTKPEVKTETKAEIKPQTQELKTQEVKAEIKPETKAEIKPQTQELKTQEVKAEIKPEVKAEVKTETKAEIKPQTQELKTQEVKAEIKSEVKAEIKPQKEELKAQEVKADVKHTPLFKAQTNQIVTTEQALQARELKITDPLNSLRKTPKERADETLKLLLRGEKAQVVDSPIKLTADFSVATAKVIAPSAMTEVQKSLESLLKGDSNEGHTSKVDGLNVAKADSFEVKLNEAKQMTKYLSHDIKQAIDDYKAPFTRIKVQLNPQRLGEVDLTVVQRGKNLHVNISSNNVAINALAMNANDLKVQLNNSGIQNATLNFNGEQQQSSQQQNQQARQEYRMLQEFDSEDKNEEILSSLEIVVPSYA